MFYHKLKNKCIIRQELLSYAHTVTDWIPKENLSFLQHTVPDTLINKDPTLNILAGTLGEHYNIGVRIFKLPAWTFYELHVDSIRTSAVNMLLNDQSNSVSFFETAPFRKNQIQIDELSYETDCLYLFNTQYKHAVLNRSEDRYVLSIAMNGLKNFENALEFINEHNL
jgi:hypothetical protein